MTGWSPPPPTAATISRVPYLRGVDGLRALALVAVVLYNANPRWVPGGFIGIEVGFVVSGYLVTLALLSMHERDGRVRIWSSWWRRARRIVPAVVVMLAVVAGYLAIWMPRVRRRQRWAALNGLTFTSNWYELWHGHLQVVEDRFQPFKHLWALAVQQQWVVVWIVIIALATRRGMQWLPRLGLALVVVAVGIVALSGSRFASGPLPLRCPTPPGHGYTQLLGHCWNTDEFHYLSTFTRLPGLLIGSAMALWWRPLAVMRGALRRRGPWIDAIALIGLGALALLGWKLHLASATDSSVRYAPRTLRGGLLAVDAATVSVLAAVTHSGSTLRRVLSMSPLHALGRRTLGWYLYHWPVLEIVRWRSPRGLTTPMIALAMAITAVVAEISFHLVERPIRSGRLGEWAKGERRPRTELAKRRRRTTIVAAVLGVAGAIVAGGWLGFARQRCADGCDAFPPITDPPTTSTTTASTQVPTTVPMSGSVSGPTNGTSRSSVSTPVRSGSTPGSLVVSASAPPAPTHAPTTTRPTPPPTTTTVFRVDPTANAPIAIGDSVMASATKYLDDQLWVSARDQRVPADVRVALEGAVKRHGWSPTVIIDVGNNGPISQRELDRMVGALPEDEVTNIFFVTVSGPGEWIDENNRLLAAMVGSDPRIRLIDWANDPNAPAIDDVPGPVQLDDESAQAYAAAIFAALGHPEWTTPTKTSTSTPSKASKTSSPVSTSTP